MDKVRVSGNQHEGANVGVGVGYLDTVGGHLDVNAVLDASRAHAVGIGRVGRRSSRGHEYGLDAGGVEGGRVVQELAGAPEFRSPGNPVRVGFGNHHASVVGDFFFKGRYVGCAVTHSQTDLEVFPVDE